MMTLSEFLSSPSRNSWIKYKSLELYVRKSHRTINGEEINAFDIANMKNVRRPQNFNFKAKHSRTGLFKEFIAEASPMLPQFDGIYIENVLNEFLPDVLLRYGFTQIPLSDPTLKCFWKSLKLLATSKT